MSETRIPIAAEIKKLPRWAIVAFAARCARRVEPLTRGLGKVPNEAIVRAIELAETSASSAHATGDGVLHGNAAIDAAAHATRSAALAAVAAVAAAYAADRGAPYTDATAAADTAARALATITGHGLSENSIVRFIAADYQRLADAASLGGWHDRTPVSPEFFGSLWPEGEPAWGEMNATEPMAATEGRELSFDLWIDPGNASAETIQEVLVALSRLHMAAGGSGLEYSPDGDFVSIRETAFA